MSKTMTITVTIEGEAATRLKELAQASGRSEAWFANFMICEYADREMEIVEDIKTALKEVKEGKVVPDEEVMAEIDAMIEAKLRRSA